MGPTRRCLHLIKVNYSAEMRNHNYSWPDKFRARLRVDRWVTAVRTSAPAMDLRLTGGVSSLLSRGVFEFRVIRLRRRWKSGQGWFDPVGCSWWIEKWNGTPQERLADGMEIWGRGEIHYSLLGDSLTRKLTSCSSPFKGANTLFQTKISRNCDSFLLFYGKTGFKW